MTNAHTVPAMSHGYRPPRRRPTGRWAQFLVRMREERDWSQAHAFEELHAILGLAPKSRASYDAIEKGPRVPTVEQQDALVRFYGKSPDDLPEIVDRPEPKDELIEAIRAQTQAMAELTAAIRDDRAGREAWERGLLSGLLDLARASQSRGQSGGRGRALPEGAAQ